MFSKYAREELVKEQLQMAIRNLGLTTNKAKIIISVLRESHDEESEYHQKSLEVLNRRYHELKAKQDKLLDIYMEDSVSKEVYDEKSELINAELTSIDSEIVKHKGGQKVYSGDRELY